MLFSPKAQENLQESYLPDGREINKRLTAYTKAMAKDLLAEFQGVLMINEHLTKEEARAILEYFQTL